MSIIGDYGLLTNLPEVGQPLSSLWAPLFICPSMWFLGRLANHSFTCPFDCHFSTTSLTSVCLSNWFFSAHLNLLLVLSFSAFVCSNFHWIFYLNNRCTCKLSPYLDSTLEPYPFPSWTSFRRNHSLWFSPCL